MSLYRRLKGHAQFQPEKTAIEFEGRVVSYQQLLQRVDECIAYFDSANIKAGDRVAFLALNHPDIFAFVFAASRVGIILVPLNWRLSVDELDYVIQDCSPSLLMHDADFADTALKLKAHALTQSGSSFIIQAIGEPLIESTGVNRDVGEKRNVSVAEQDDELSRDFLIVYTSGTTGRPKGAVLNQQAILCGAEMSQHMLDLTSHDRVLNVLPLFHVGGLNIQPLPTLLYGGTLFLHTRFDPAMAARAMEEHKITLINSVPTVLQAILATEEWKTSSYSDLRAVSIGSTDVPMSLINKVRERDIALIQIYGATETSPAAIYQKIEHSDKVGSIGKAGLLCDIRLVDENDQVVETGCSGEIHVKGRNILSYYWNNNEATESSVDNGWFKTGDVAHEDNDGFYWFDDRVKHVIISGGENIYPAELERVIGELPGIEAVSVVGQADQRWGEVPVAVIVGNATEKNIKDACTKVARFKQPKQLYFVDELPRNALGKIQVQRVKELVTTLANESKQ